MPKPPPLRIGSRIGFAIRSKASSHCAAGPVRRAALRLSCHSASSYAPEGPAALDDATSVFVRANRRLFGLAYRMLGSAVETEDVVAGRLAAVAGDGSRNDECS